MGRREVYLICMLDECWLLVVKKVVHGMVVGLCCDCCSGGGVRSPTGLWERAVTCVWWAGGKHEGFHLVTLYSTCIHVRWSQSNVNKISVHLERKAGIYLYYPGW